MIPATTSRTGRMRPHISQPFIGTFLLTRGGLFLCGRWRTERLGDPLDGLALRWAHALPVLPVRGRDPHGEGDNEPAVLVNLIGRRLTLQHRHRGTQVSQPAVAELFDRAVPRVVRL